MKKKTGYVVMYRWTLLSKIAKNVLDYEDEIIGICSDKSIGLKLSRDFIKNTKKAIKPSGLSYKTNTIRDSDILGWACKHQDSSERKTHGKPFIEVSLVDGKTAIYEVYMIDSDYYE